MSQNAKRPPGTKGGEGYKQWPESPILASRMTQLDAYDYELPKDRIAQTPLAVRSDARLLLADRNSGKIEHWHVRDLPELLAAQDTLVLNDTRVLPARLVGRRSLTGGRWEGLFLAADRLGLWKVLGRTRGKIQPGEQIVLVDPEGRDRLTLELIEKGAEGEWLVRVDSQNDPYAVLERVGRTPLPHYIRGGEMLPEDRQRYQTVFAQHPGSIAAPTAGLHLDEQLFSKLAEKNVSAAYLTLHVGRDTFRPITAESLDAHPMHTEWAHLDAETADRLNSCRAAGGRIVAVGTTSVRLLETAAVDGSLAAYEGSTDLFIRPPHRFEAVDALITNFHLPRTTLLVLVRTFGGDELIQRAYREAVEQQYRFYSYGDAMLIL